MAASALSRRPLLLHFSCQSFRMLWKAKVQASWSEHIVIHQFTWRDALFGLLCVLAIAVVEGRKKSRRGNGFLLTLYIVYILDKAFVLTLACHQIYVNLLCRRI
uniref:Uncharacterized protein n=1 Tax=Oryza glumipatula TaxID=40148 RepID=A0A0D9Z185_9ORYZ